GPAEVPIGRRHALAREWAVLISGAGVQACLAAWEQPADDEVPDASRRFEVVWSFEPDVVTDAVEVAEQILSPLDIGLARRLRAARGRMHPHTHPPSAPRSGG